MARQRFFSKTTIYLKEAEFIDEAIVCLTVLKRALFFSSVAVVFFSEKGKRRRTVQSLVGVCLARPRKEILICQTRPQ